MHDTSEIYQLLQIAALAQQWPALHPIRDRAMEKLVAIAKEPAHQEPPLKKQSAQIGPQSYIGRREING